MTTEELQASIGKRVCVKTLTGSVCGRLDFAGQNENFPTWGFQVTVGGMPMQNIEPKDVALFVPRELVKKEKEVSSEQITEIFNEAKEKFGTTLQKLSE